MHNFVGDVTQVGLQRNYLEHLREVVVELS